MIHPNIRREIAERYHRALPAEVRRHLNGRGLPDDVIDRFLLGWNGERITLPIFDRQGDIVTFRYGKGPEDTSDSPKMRSEVGSTAELYGWDTLARNPHRVVICEGEYDRLVLEANGFPAVTSTGGSRTFLKEWAPHFDGIEKIFICMDRDHTGEAGAKKVKEFLPRATIVRLPEAVGPKGDVTDYFVKLGHSAVDFDLLLATAEIVADESAPKESGRPRDPKRHKAVLTRATNLKRAIAIEKFIEQYTDLAPTGRYFRGLCPFHDEKTPSFTVYPDTGTYYCFGCQSHGDLIAFLMNKESMTFGQALTSLERYREIDEFGVA